MKMSPINAYTSPIYPIICINATFSFYVATILAAILNEDIVEAKIIQAYYSLSYSPNYKGSQLQSLSTPTATIANRVPTTPYINSMVVGFISHNLRVVTPATEKKNPARAPQIDPMMYCKFVVLGCSCSSSSTTPISSSEFVAY